MQVARRSSILLCAALSLPALAAAQSNRYKELKRVIDRNTGFAHFTRGVNMYTLYALRACVTPKDIAVLSEMLTDKDRVTQMAAAEVLVDFGNSGRQAVESRLSQTKNVSDKLMLRDALDEAAKPSYRPILDYPLTDEERRRINGCK